MVDGEPVILQVPVEPVSTSEALSLPVAELVPAKVLPLRLLPASTRVPARAATELVTNGESLLPVIENTSAALRVVALPSVTWIAPKFSLTIWPAGSTWVAAAVLLRL